MNRDILIIQYSQERLKDVNSYLAKNDAKILCHHKKSYHILAEAKNFNNLPPSSPTLIQNPHPDLLSAFFNLLPRSNFNPNLCLKSQSLISLMNFYQNLLNHHNFTAIEITYSSETSHFYGLLYGEDRNIAPIDNIEIGWLDDRKILNPLYNI